MARSDELRLIARVAKMYHIDGIKQSDIAERLHISQTTISRLLRRARDENIVRITIAAPSGTYLELEQALRSRFGISDAIVADCDADREDAVLASIGAAAAHYLETTLGADDVVGISSWSESLVRTVDAFHPPRPVAAERVVQILGGMGDPSVQRHATSLTVRLAKLTHATPVLLATQGVARSAAVREILVDDPFVRETFAQFARLTIALVGIGAIGPSRLLADSGNAFTSDELADLEQLGAVGDMCLRFFDASGTLVASPLDERVIAISLAQLRAVPRVVAVAGGRRKVDAIAGALHSGLVDVLITDRFTAAALVAPVAEASHA